MKIKKKEGFTLVELSIVIIIIGFLIAGVSAGTSLIKQAQLNAVIFEKTNFVTLVNTFKEKYGYYPGDLPKATSYWVSAAANGNGDGLVDWFNNQSVRESVAAWQHLGLSGILPGNYTGLGSDLDNGVTASLNAPGSKFNNGLWIITNNLYVVNEPSFAGVVNLGNFLFLGGYNYNNIPGTPLFKPLDAQNLDIKIDDGQPFSGDVFSVNGCATGNMGQCNVTCVSGGNFAIASDAPGCLMGFFFDKQ